MTKTYWVTPHNKDRYKIKHRVFHTWQDAEQYIKDEQATIKRSFEHKGDFVYEVDYPNDKPNEFK